MRIPLKNLVYVSVGALLPTIYYFSVLSTPAHFDYETCVESAAVNVAYAEALTAMTTSCSAQYPARRDAAGQGYVYTDNATALSFKVSSAVPNEVEWKLISARIEEHTANLAKLAEEEAQREAVALSRKKTEEMQAKIRARQIAAQLEAQRQECRQRNATRLEEWQLERVKQTEKIRYPQKTKYLPDIYHDRTGLFIDVVNSADWPIKHLSFKFAWSKIDYCGKTFDDTVQIVGQKPLRPNVKITKFFADQTNANYLDQESWLCLKLDEVRFDFSPSLESCS